MSSRLRFMGWASTVSGWLVILVAVSRNPWFVFTENAFSDLGAASANMPWLFNVGMMLTGVMIVLFGVYLLQTCFNGVSRFGNVSMMVTGVFLLLIGIFPEGTRYHFRVSVGFFGMGALTVLIWGLALLRHEKYRSHALLFVFMGVVGPIGAILVPWPSTAVVEAYGILLLNIWVALMTRITPNLTDSSA